ncbi:O-antigen ligase family protein [Pisciglobus halotolerans]|uniref:O-antigen ligase like membrane protein n=1 Tax=Pisciglobus halotolerans TaxID=745365 RepID=A0A1I3DKP2_9LACT|nr:O-antigen ligase family protein [Pisciglobus halotolerans]SFH87285.1 O-antigen ligase like membrane protein [Pisciglobus halotolerans]
MRKFIIFMAVFSSLIFTTLSNMFIIPSKDLIYAIYVFIISISAVTLVTIDYLKRNKINLRDIWILGVPVLMILLILISINKYQLNDKTFNMVIQFISLCIPSYLGGFYIKKFNKQNSFYDMTFALNIMVTIILFYSYLKTPLDNKGYFYNFGESSHLFIGYTAGVFLIFNIISLLNKKNRRQKNKSIILTLKFFLILLQFWLIVGSGSRGALFAVIGTLSVYIFLNKDIKKKQIFIFIIIIFCTFLIGINIDESFRNGFENFTKILLTENEFIDLSASRNGRDVQYTLALELFKGAPIFGKGVLGYSSITNLAYPHNLVLELLSNYGLLFTLASIIVILISLRNNIRIESYSLPHVFIVFMFIFNIIAMQLSYSILTNSYFWFGLAYCLTQSSNYKSSKEGL